jgi:hypothetical protein
MAGKPLRPRLSPKPFLPREPLTFYRLHDADGPGTMIYQTLQDGTRSRPDRQVEIINLGLDPAEAVDMELPAEKVEGKGRRSSTSSGIGWVNGKRV